MVRCISWRRWIYDYNENNGSNSKDNDGSNDDINSKDNDGSNDDIISNVNHDNYGSNIDNEDDHDDNNLETIAKMMNMMMITWQQ